MNSNGSAFVMLILSLGIVLFVWLVIRSLVLWYFRINRIVELLEQIESNTRVVASSSQIDMDDETNYYVNNGVRVTNYRLIVPPNEWAIEQFQPVKVEFQKGKYKLRLLDKKGNEIHFLDSDNEERIKLVAAAINKALNADSDSTQFRDNALPKSRFRQFD